MATRSRKPRPAARPTPRLVTVDVVVLTASGGHLRGLVVRQREKADSRWSLPNGPLLPDESLQTAAARILAAQAGLRDVFLEQLYTFADRVREPKAARVTVAYYALVDRQRFPAAGARSDVAIGSVVVPWEGETGGPVELLDEHGKTMRLPSDHADVMGMAVKRVRGKLDYTPIGFQLLPPTFTLRQLQDVHETVLGRPLNKDSFRRRMLSTGLLEATGEKQDDVDHRPAELYRFAKRSAV